jgi:predicted Rossmann fold flavoprotein
LNEKAKTYDVVIIGGGAAGLMCAIEAGKRNRTVLVIENSDSIGKKIAISGGGRCNFTNRFISRDNFISNDPHFCEPVLEGFTSKDFIGLVEKYKIKYHEKKLGQLFCDGSSGQIVSMLATKCQKADVKIIVECKTTGISKKERFEIVTSGGKFLARSLVIATGGISMPKIGASDFGYRVATQFDIKRTAIKPALVPLTFNAEDKKIFGDLGGVSLDAIVSCGEIAFRENILFTHKGLSGPAILQISSYWKQGESISLNFLPDENLFDLLSRNSKRKIELKNFLSTIFPKRFAEIFCDAFFKSRRLKQYSQKDFLAISEKVHDCKFYPSGTEGFAKAEVTLGGVDTAELSPKTMELKKVNGLYFIGEVVDVTGWLGGYNFQWAWSSGAAAGRDV